jgi:hypothetical protein
VDGEASVVVAVAIAAVAKEDVGAATPTPAPTINVKAGMEVLVVVTPGVVDPLAATPRSSARCA